LGYIPTQKSAQVNFLWGKMTSERLFNSFIHPKKLLYPPKQISGYAPENGPVKHHHMAFKLQRVFYFIGKVFCFDCRIFLFTVFISFLSSIVLSLILSSDLKDDVEFG